MRLGTHADAPFLDTPRTGTISLPTTAQKGPTMIAGRCAVLGAGVGGLAAAIFLARQGWEVDLFESSPVLRAQGSGFVLQPGGQAVLDRLGLWEGVGRRGAPVRRIWGIDAADGRTAIDLRVVPARCHGVAVERGGVIAALANAALAAGVALHLGATACGWDKDQVLWDTRERPPPVPPGTRWDACVDATGAGGFSPLHAPLLPYGAFWATVPWVDGVEGTAPDQLSQRYHRTTHMAGVLPLGHDTAGHKVAAFFWSIRLADVARVQAQGFPTWKDGCLALWPAIAPFLDTLSSWEDLPLARYSHGRLVHPHAPGLARIGDAAHRTSPQLGQGANMALLDAWALAEAVQAAPAWDAACERARRARALHTWTYHHLSGLFTPQYQSDRTGLAILRNRVFAPLGRLPFGPWALTRLSAGLLVPAVRGLPAP